MSGGARGLIGRLRSRARRVRPRRGREVTLLSLALVGAGFILGLGSAMVVV